MTETQGLNIAVVGATGAVGQTNDFNIRKP